MTCDPRADRADAVALDSLICDLRELRQDLGLAQREVAHRMGCSRSMVSYLETGQRPFSMSNLQRYIRALGCKLVIEVEPPPPRAPGPVTAVLSPQQETP